MFKKLLNKTTFTENDINFVVQNKRNAPVELLVRMGLASAENKEEVAEAPVQEEVAEAPVQEEVAEAPKRTRRNK